MTTEAERAYLALLEYRVNLALAIARRATASATQFAFVFRPGGVTAGNVFATWAALYAALAAVAGPKIVYLDDTLTPGVPCPVTPGHYDLRGVEFRGIGDADTAVGNSAVNFQDGVTLVPGGNMWFKACQASYSGTTPCITNSAAGDETNVYVSDNAWLYCTSTGAFLSATGGFGLVIALQSQVGDGTNPVATAAGGTIEAQATGGEIYDVLSFAANAITGAGAVVYWDSVEPAAQGAGVILVHQNDYVTATPGSWAGAPPTTQDAALDRIAAAVAGLLGHPIP